MSFKLTIHVFGLCVVKEPDASYHRVIGVAGADHHFFVVVPRTNIDDSSTLKDYITKGGARFFPLAAGTILEVKTPSARGLGKFNDKQDPATIADLGLTELNIGVGTGSFLDGELALCLLPVADTKTAWLDVVGNYKFPGSKNPAMYRDVADHFMWRGLYNSKVTLEARKGNIKPQKLVLKSIGADFSIGVGCVKLTESGKPFSDAEAFHLVSKGAVGCYKEPKQDDHVRAFHVGSSSCPPVMGP